MFAQLFLYFFALLAFISALGMLFSKSPMRVALSLISTMVSLAAIFAILGNHVLAIFQVLIYVGAIMVFMIYIIMLLDSKEQKQMGHLSKYALPTWILFFLSFIFLVPKFSTTTQTGYIQNWNIASFAKLFLNEYFLFFELTSVVLLITTLGVITLIKEKKNVAN